MIRHIYFLLVTFLSLVVIPVEGGRYGDPDQVKKLIVPLIFSGIIFLGLLALLIFFQCHNRSLAKCCLRCRQMCNDMELVEEGSSIQGQGHPNLRSSYSKACPCFKSPNHPQTNENNERCHCLQGQGHVQNNNNGPCCCSQDQGPQQYNNNSRPYCCAPVQDGITSGGALQFHSGPHKAGCPCIISSEKACEAHGCTCNHLKVSSCGTGVHVPSPVCHM